MELSHRYSETKFVKLSAIIECQQSNILGRIVQNMIAPCCIIVKERLTLGPFILIQKMIRSVRGSHWGYRIDRGPALNKVCTQHICCITDGKKQKEQQGCKCGKA